MIAINLLRITPDSQYLEFWVECPTDYRFNRLDIWKYDDVAGMQDCSTLLSATSTEEIIRISTSALTMEKTIIYVQFGVTYIGTGDGVDIPNVIGVCSDVNDTYFALFDKIESLILDNINHQDYIDMIKIKMVRDAHIEAMSKERFSDAENLFETLQTLIAKIRRDLDPINYTV